MGRNLPLRMAIVGPDRFSTHHVESIRLRQDLVVKASFDPLRDGRASAGVVGAAATEGCFQELLSRDDVDCVLFAGWIDGRAALAEACVKHGKDVALEPRPCDAAAELSRLIDQARCMGRGVCVLPVRPEGSDFDTALEVVRGGCLGRLRSARLMSWTKGLPLQEGEGTDAFAVIASQYVDQALELMQSAPRSVFARVASVGTAGAGAAFTIVIAFDGEADAAIDVDLRSGTFIQTGWVMAGERGGYSGQRVFVTEESGEVCDAPASQKEPAWHDPYRELLSVGSRSCDSAKKAVAVVQILNAARESARSGHVITLDR